MTETTTLIRLKELLQEAERAATMESMSIGFPDDRIEIKSVHFGDDNRGRVGDVMHPDTYVRNITSIYRNSWLLGPLRQAIALVESNQELINRCSVLADSLQSVDLERIHDLARASKGRRD